MTAIAHYSPSSSPVGSKRESTDDAILQMIGLITRMLQKLEQDTGDTGYEADSASKEAKSLAAIDASKVQDAAALYDQFEQLLGTTAATASSGARNEKLLQELETLLQKLIGLLNQLKESDAKAGKGTDTDQAILKMIAEFGKFLKAFEDEIAQSVKNDVNAFDKLAELVKVAGPVLEAIPLLAALTTTASRDIGKYKEVESILEKLIALLKELLKQDTRDNNKGVSNVNN